MMPLEAAEQRELVKVVFATGFSAIAAATVLIYDHLITLGSEVDLIWRKSWSIVKVLFVWHRYFGLTCVGVELAANLSSSVSDEFCTFWFRWELLGFSTGVLTSEVVLLLWVYVVYGKNVRLALVLGFLLLAELLSVYTILGLSWPSLHVVTDFVDDRTYCAISSRTVPLGFFFFWVPILGYNVLILSLLIFRGWQLISRHRTTNRLLVKVYQGSMINFLAMLASYVLCFTFWLAAPFRYAQIPAMLALSFSIINASRLLLNIRYAYYNYQGSLKLTRRDVNPVLRDIVGPVYVDNDAAHQPWMFELRELRWDGR